MHHITTTFLECKCITVYTDLLKLNYHQATKIKRVIKIKKKNGKIIEIKHFCNLQTIVVAYLKKKLR
jgi:hypothetical protein